MNRMLIIGLDGASFSLIDPLIAAGKLPHLAALQQEGVRATLQSTIPPASCPAWDSFITGKNPGKLGVYDVFHRKPGTYELGRPDARDRKGVSFWNLLPGRSIIVNIPTTFPPEQVNGMLVAGRGATEDSAYTYPPELQEELDQVTGGYIVTPDHHLTIANLQETLRKRRLAILHLMEKPWDLFVVNLLATDVVCHGYWGTPEVGKAYVLLDALVGEMRAKAGPGTTTLVLSDHGIGPPSLVFWPNSWLQEEGFLVAAKRTHRLAGLKRRARAGLERAHLLGIAARATPRRVRSLVPEHGPTLQDAAVDWSRTQAYSIYGNMPRIFINLQGREPQGAVPPEEYEHVRDRIIARLQAIRHPAVRSIRVYKREEIYRGPYVDLAPDLLVQFNDFSAAYMQPYLGQKEWLTPMKSNFGWHRPEGIFLLAGPGIGRGNVPDLSIMDIAPLVIHLFGQPIPRDMDGAVRQDLFPAGSPHQRAVAFQEALASSAQQGPSLTQEQEEKILQQLKSLGYS